jgi:hypothetical protein
MDNVCCFVVVFDDFTLWANEFDEWMLFIKVGICYLVNGIKIEQKSPKFPS